jgi:hypothetical protein
MGWGFPSPDPTVKPVIDPDNIPRSGRADWRLRREDASGKSRQKAYGIDLASEMTGINLRTPASSVSRQSSPAVSNTTTQGQQDGPCVGHGIPVPDELEMNKGRPASAYQGNNSPYNTPQATGNNPRVIPDVAKENNKLSRESSLDDNTRASIENTSLIAHVNVLAQGEVNPSSKDEEIILNDCILAGMAGSVKTVSYVRDYPNQIYL